LTPDPALNERARGVAAMASADILLVDDDAREIAVAPAYLQNHRWLVSRNVPFMGDEVSFFLYDGWIYTDGAFSTNMRRRRFATDVTERIASNAYHLAYYREQVVEDEVVLFVVSPTAQTVTLQLDGALFGEDRTLTFPMEQGEGR